MQPSLSEFHKMFGFKDASVFTKIDGNYWITYEICKSRRLGEFTPRLNEFITDIVVFTLHKLQYETNKYYDDLKQEALYNIFKYIFNFDHTKTDNPNPYAYITYIATNSITLYLKDISRDIKIRNMVYNDTIKKDNK